MRHRQRGRAAKTATDSTAAFFAAWEAATTSRRGGGRRFPDLPVTITLGPAAGGLVELYMISLGRGVPKKTGIATRAMRQLHALADEHGVTIVLEPTPMGRGVTDEDLRRWYGKLGYRPLDDSLQIREPKRRGRAQLSPKSQIRRVGGRAAIAFTNIRTDRLYCICPITDGKLYVDVPDTDHLLRLLATRRWRSTAHLHTISGYVPYFGGAIAFHAENLLLKGVKPHWFIRASTWRSGMTHEAAWRRRLEARRQVIEDGLYADDREADQFHSGYPGECEWEGPSGLRFGPEDIADVYAASLDLRSKRGRLLKKLVPGVLVKKGLPQRAGRPCR